MKLQTAPWAISDWYTALQYATNQASLEVTKIIDLIDPPRGARVGLDLVLAAVMTGLSPFVAPELGMMELTGVVEKAVASVIAAIVDTRPFVARAIWPKDMDDSRLVEMRDISQYLLNLDNDISDRLNAGIHVIMSDINAFTSFGEIDSLAPTSLHYPKKRNY